MDPLLLAALRCPECHGPISRDFQCERCGPFPVVAGQPVLVDFAHSILEKRAFLNREGDSPIHRRRSGMKRVLEALHGTNRSAERFALEICKRVPPTGRVLVVGGGAIGSGAKKLYERGLAVGADIYPTPHTVLIADAHNIPFADDTFEAVWIQAVLEHVLSPHEVVAELHRVLKPGGYIYADTPFIQHVHEEAYDFTRFTLSGHRWLFRDFDLIEAGPTKGAGTSLVWSIRYFVRAVTGSDAAGSIVAAAFFWLRFFDRRTRKHADAASATYFFGRKSGERVKPNDMVRYYYELR
jgi:SAM-dependent methyltransferase